MAGIQTNEALGQVKGSCRVKSFKNAIRNLDKRLGVSYYDEAVEAAQPTTEVVSRHVDGLSCLFKGADNMRKCKYFICNK